MRPTVIRSIALALLLSAGAATAQPAPITAIKAGRLIADPSRDRGAPALILVEGNRIRAVLPADAPVPEGARLVDLSDATVLPGLIDLHVHLTGDPGRSPLHFAQTTSERTVATGARNALLTVKAGFTTVRDLGAPPLASLALRDAIAAGDLVGPRIQAAGAGISIIGGHADVSGFRPDVNEVLSSGNSCTGPEQCAARVREAARRGVDVIKITATGGVLSQQARGLELHFTPAEMKAIVETADSLGLKVMAHAHGDSGIRGAVEAGVSTVEHGTFASAETLRLMRQKGTWYVPTLMAFQGLADRVGKGIFTPVVELKARAALAQWGNGLAAAVRAGVPIAFGTDAGVFEHGRNGEEFALMVEKGGMSPRAALVAATVDAARAAGLSDEIGTIAPGKAADIVAVSGDPLADPRTLQKMRFVMANGRIVPLD
ncbi:MAG: amidohydrolase family protein [Sphingomonadaceae bacterium]